MTNHLVRDDKKVVCLIVKLFLYIIMLSVIELREKKINYAD